MGLPTNQANSHSDKRQQHLQQCKPAVMEENEAKRIIASQSLSSLKLGDFLVVTNSDFDLTISDEPYLALMLLYNLKSGKYLARIWNQTVAVGWAFKDNELNKACQDLFGQGMPCIGYPIKQCQIENTLQHYLVSHTPIPRIVSKTCQKFLGQFYRSDCLSCLECQKLRGSNENDKKESSFQDPMQAEDEYGENVEVKNEDFGDDLSHNSNYLCESWKGIISTQPTKKLTQIHKQEVHKLTNTTTQGTQGTKPDQSNGKGNAKEYQSEVKSCPWCDKVLSNAYMIYEHRVFAHHFGKFQCPICHLKFNFTKDVVEHMKVEAHIGEIHCFKCNKDYPMSEIESHYVMCATGCFICNKTFASEGGFSMHKKTAHIGEQGGEEKESNCCEMCGKRFKNRYSLKNHRSQICKGNGKKRNNKPTPCSVCGMMFKTYQSMCYHRNKEHRREEHERQCQKCGLQFCNLPNLKSHLRSHEAPQFKCGFCGKMLKKKSILESHEMAHRGEKPFQCSLCPSSFANNGNLAQHMKGVHKIAGPKGGKIGWVHGKKQKQSDT